MHKPWVPLSHDGHQANVIYHACNIRWLKIVRVDMVNHVDKYKIFKKGNQRHYLGNECYRRKVQETSTLDSEFEGDFKGNKTDSVKFLFSFARN